MFVFILSISLRWLVPPNPGYNSLHDDQLLVTLAHNIINDHWLGSYREMGHLLLSKPPGYSIFLAYTHWLPWAPTVTIHLVLLIGFLLILREMRLLDFSRGFCLASFTLFAFYPVWFSETMSRLYRDGLLAALTTIFVSFALILRRQIRQSEKLRNQIPMSFLIGLTAGLFYITKPSWHFLLPIFLGIVFLSDVSAQINDFAVFRSRLKRGMITLLTASLSFMLLPGYVKMQNEHHYGVFAIDSFSEGGFPEAMKAIYSAREPLNRPYIDSTSQARADLYLVSPTMRSLKDFLELPIDQGWRSQPCHSDLGVCDESGAWFPWEVRDSIQKSGQGDTAEEFEETSHKIANEIRSACRKNIIICDNEGLAPGLDSLDTLSLRSLTDSFAKGIQFLINPATGYQERGEFREVAKETINVWESTIKGLPPRKFATKYESNDLFFGDVRKVIIQFYGALWIPAIFLSIVGLIIRRRGVDKVLSETLRILSLSMLAGISILILQISMLQASSGYYMNSGGDLYLLPLHALLLIVVALGLHRLSLVILDVVKGAGCTESS